MVNIRLKHIFLLALFITGMNFSPLCFSEDTQPFDLSNGWKGQDFLKWQVGFIPVPSRVENAALTINFPDNDGYLISPPLFLNSSIYPFLKITMKTSKSFQKARVFWCGPYNKTFDRQFSLPIAIGGNWGYHTYIIDMSRHGGWGGNIERLMISPVNGGGIVEIKEVFFFEYSPFLKLRAALQEFFSMETNPIPPNLGMVFVIVGPMLFGKPINLIISSFAATLFVIMLLLIIGRSALSFFRSSSSQDIGRIFKANLLLACFLITCALFFAWIAVEAQYFFNDIKVLTADGQAMWGKSLDEKRSVITGGDLYEYLQFCDKALPKGAGVDFVFSDNLYYSFPEWLPTKARYYLFPKYQDVKSPYKLVFGPNAEAKLDITKRYALFAKFKENELILKEIE